MQVIRFFLYTILYWTLPRDRVIEPEEEEEEPLAPEDDAKSDAKKDPKKGDLEEKSHHDVEMGTVPTLGAVGMPGTVGTSVFADGSSHGMGQPLAPERRASTKLNSLDLGRRQSLSRDINRHKSLESLGSQELFGWNRDGLGLELGPGRSGSTALTMGRSGSNALSPGRSGSQALGPGRSASAALESRSSLQTAPSFKRSPRTPKKQAD